MSSTPTEWCSSSNSPCSRLRTRALVSHRQVQVGEKPAEHSGAGIGQGEPEVARGGVADHDGREDRRADDADARPSHLNEKREKQPDDEHERRDDRGEDRGEAEAPPYVGVGEQPRIEQVALLQQAVHRVVAPLGGSSPSASYTPCRGQTDSAGNTSLEAIVADLFSGTSGQLQGAKLPALPDEIASLLDDVRIDSQMTITASGEDINSYAIRHDLLELTFPDALASISFKVQALGLPVSSASGILATLRAGQLSIPGHGFTLRLGTAARYAFEATSLRSRGAQDTGSLVKAVFALAQKVDQGNVLSGCQALDAAVCDQLVLSRGCLLDACQNGLAALATQLAGAFDGLDGGGLDFFLSGYTPVVDLDGDGLADALGLGGRAGTVAAGPGLWSATLDAQAGADVIYGSWHASRVTSGP